MSQAPGFDRSNTTSTSSSRSSAGSRSSRWSRSWKHRSPSPVGRRQSGFKSEAESMTSSRSSTMPKLKQETFPVYNLCWQPLKGYLEARFPGYVFEERKVNKDYYQFDVPEPLTKEERDQILKLKDRKVLERGPSPERSTLGVGSW